MKCVKCGNEVDENSSFCGVCGEPFSKPKSFCGKCGSEVDPTSPFCGSCGNALNFPVANTQTKTVSDLFQSLKGKLGGLKPYIHKYRYAIIILIAAIILGLSAYFAYQTFHDFTKLSWNPEDNDANVTYTQSTTLNLSVLAYDKEGNPITDITFEVDSGEITSDGTLVSWVLPREAGEYTIKAIAPSGKSISKSVNVVVLDDGENGPLFGLETVEEETDDNDGDGLTNAEEETYGTNKNSADTDGDGISDYYEIYETKTDPLNPDTDGDGINDGNELDLGLDPLKEDSKDDGIKDGDRTLNYTVSSSNSDVVVEIVGKGNIATSTIDIFTNTTFENMDGLLGTVYNLYSDGTVSSATVKIKYDVEEIKNAGLSEENLTFYYFNEDTKELEAVPTTVDQKNHQIIATLSHFSRYVIGDKDVVLANTETEILFVIDNSISMYSESQMEALGYYSSTGAIGNDTTFKRLTLTNNMVDMFTGNYQFGVSEFSGNYVNLIAFSNDTTAVKNAVNTMENNWNSNAEGTNIVSALKTGIDEFSSDIENKHYLILLTDGKNTAGSLRNNKTTIISNAQSNHVRICVIGLGNDVDTDDLEDIAVETGCAYYSASDSSALDEIYATIGSDINYSLIDTDGDNVIDGMIEQDTGFLVNRDGFSFANFASNKSNGGHCYGMAAFAMLYYVGELPLKVSSYDVTGLRLRYLRSLDWHSTGYNLSNTYFATGAKLYDFKITNEALQIMLGEIPGDYRDRVEDDTWMIKQTYYDMLSEIGATFSIKDYSGKDYDFSKYQSALLTIDDDTFNNAVSKDEAEVLKAIWLLYMLQVDAASSTSFTSSPDKAFEELAKGLNDGTPLVLGIGDHAINAIKLIQDIDDANKFKIAVYDNNYPGETRYIEVTRTKYSKFQLNYTAWVNEYNYTFKYDKDDDGEAEDITVSISYPDVSLAS